MTWISFAWIKHTRIFLWICDVCVCVCVHCVVQWENGMTNQICNDFGLAASMMPYHYTIAQCLFCIIIICFAWKFVVAQFFSRCFRWRLCGIVARCATLTKFLYCHDKTTKHFAILGKYIEKNAHTESSDTHFTMMVDIIHAIKRKREVEKQKEKEREMQKNPLQLKKVANYLQCCYIPCLCRLFPILPLFRDSFPCDFFFVFCGCSHFFLIFLTFYLYYVWIFFVSLQLLVASHHSRSLCHIAQDTLRTFRPFSH